MSTLKVDNLQTTGGAGLYPARAWVNFNGSGTVAIRGSGNVSSITDNGVGQYTVNFSTAITDANYATSVTSDLDNGSGWSMGGNIHGTSYYSSSSVRVRSIAKQNGTNLDGPIMGINMVR